MKRVLISSIRKGEKFRLFASDGNDEFFVRGYYCCSTGKYACFFRGSVLMFLGRNMRVYRLEESNA